MIAYVWPWHWHMLLRNSALRLMDIHWFDIRKSKVLKKQKLTSKQPNQNNNFLSTHRILQVAKSTLDFMWLAVVQRQLHLDSVY